MMLANVERLAENMSINFETVQTHPFAGTFSIGRSKTEEEMAQFREIGADFYDEFLTLVADTRGLDKGRVRELARGRIWSGLSALDLGLVDRHGGLLEAVQRAADLAGIGDDFQIEERPRARTLEEQIEELFGVSARSLIPWSKRSPVGEFIESTYEELNRLALLNDPYGQYAILPYTLNIR
jgi:protease-4